jgi:hypothetical protein
MHQTALFLAVLSVLIFFSRKGTAEIYQRGSEDHHSSDTSGQFNRDNQFLGKGAGRRAEGCQKSCQSLGNSVEILNRLNNRYPQCRDRRSGLRLICETSGAW